jgi:6-pyruvoyltetrahydropterin/6-carboxytetrahydropterin synthase
MYEVTVNAVISASHHLRGYKGKCERVHGHNWKVEATVRAVTLDPTGLVVDFGTLRALLRDVTEAFDHTDLNTLDEFKDQNPSSENLARLLYEKLSKKVNDDRVKVTRVQIWETEGSMAVYHEGVG